VEPEPNEAEHNDVAHQLAGERLDPTE